MHMEPAEFRSWKGGTGLSHDLMEFWVNYMEYLVLQYSPD